MAERTADRRRLLLIGNPRARSGTEAGDRAPALETLGLEVTFAMPDGIDALHELIRKIGPAVDRIVIAGGDGSVAAALLALLEVEVPLAVMPLGTANELARNLDLPEARDAQLRLVAEGPVRRIGRRRAIPAGGVVCGTTRGLRRRP